MSFRVTAYSMSLCYVAANNVRPNPGLYSLRHTTHHHKISQSFDASFGSQNAHKAVQFNKHHSSSAACQISERSNDCKHRSLGFEVSRKFTLRRVMKHLWEGIIRNTCARRSIVKPQRIAFMGSFSNFWFPMQVLNLLSYIVWDYDNMIVYFDYSFE